MAFASGQGLFDDPYIITNASQLQEMSNFRSALCYFKLGNDIDCSETLTWNDGAGFEPIGYDVDNYFQGYLEGDGHKITNLYINRNQPYCSLLGFVHFHSYIQNVTFENCKVYSQSYYTGIIAGAFDGSSFSMVWRSYATNIKLINCEVKTASWGGLAFGYLGEGVGTVSGQPTIVENLFIKNGKLTFTTVDASSVRIGGIAGACFNTSLLNCGGDLEINTPQCMSDNTIGGFFGMMGYNMAVQDCYIQVKFTGSATGSTFSGISYKLISLYTGSSNYINNTYVAADYSQLTGTPEYNCSGLFPGITYTSNMFNSDTVGTFVTDLTYGKTTAEMQTKSTYEALGWDFTGTWGINSGQYPGLRTLGWTEEVQGETSEITSTDSIDLSITEETSTAYMTSAEVTDTFTATLNEEKNIEGTSTTQDSITPSISDLSTITANSASNDTTNLSITENKTLSTDITKSETLTLNLSENRTIQASTTISDSLNLSLTDNSQITANIIASDSILFSVGELTQNDFLTLAKTSSDTITVSVTELYKGTEISTSDSLDLWAGERDFNFDRNTSDPLTVSLGESKLIAVTTNVNDSIFITGSEVSNVGKDLIIRELTLSDLIAINISESSNNTGYFETYDVLKSTVTDSNESSAILNIADIINVILSEIKEPYDNMFSITDSLAIGVTEISDKEVRLVVSDGLSTAIKETYSISNSLIKADNINITLNESIADLLEYEGNLTLIEANDILLLNFSEENSISVSRCSLNCKAKIYILEHKSKAEIL
jgi:hypothetical protein